MASQPIFQTSLLQRTAVAVLSFVLLVGSVAAAQALAAARSGGHQVPVVSTHADEIGGVLMVVPEGWTNLQEQAERIETQHRLQDVKLLADPDAQQRTLLIAAAEGPAPLHQVLMNSVRVLLGSDVRGIEQPQHQDFRVSNWLAGRYYAALARTEEGVRAHMVIVATPNQRNYWIIHLSDLVSDNPEVDLDSVRPRFEQDVYLALNVLRTMRPAPQQ